MAAFTKKAIVESFMSLCARKTPDRITVKNIIDDCEINRNTFYYYFQDIYAVIEDIFNSLAADLSKHKENGDFSLEDWLRASAENALKHKKAITNIYVSLGRDRFEDYLTHAFADSWTDYVRSRTKHPVNEPTLLNTVKISRYMLFSLICDWIRGSMSESCENFAKNLTKTVGGIIDFFSHIPINNE